MTLTRDQALVAAGILALTLNQDLKHPQHVKTAAGAKWYKQPIGSLIIAKPHPHDLGEHQKLIYVENKSFAVPAQAEVWVPGGTDLNNPASVAVVGKWVKLAPPGEPGQWAMLDQWAAQHGKPGETVTEAGSTQHELQLKDNGWKLLPPVDQKVPVLVQGKLGGWIPQNWKLYAYAVGTTTVRFARDTGGNWHIITSEGVAPLGPTTATPAELDGYLKSGMIKPVAEVFPGEHADLPEGVHPPAPGASRPAPSPPPPPKVPAGWKLFTGYGGYYAKDEAGDWYELPVGEKPIKSGLAPDVWNDDVAQGILKPVAPAAPGPEPAWLSATTSIPKGVAGKGGPGHGEIQVNAKQIDQAITILNNDKSTAVKQPLQKAGHPLWEMAYHDISKQVLKEHPELKIPPGTKSKHVGQVKINILHHLASKINDLAVADAVKENAEQAAQAQAGHAAHAQEAAGHVVTVAGKEFTTEQVQAALEALESSTHWKVLAVLKAANSPLGTGTWQGYKAWAQDHPEFAKDAKAGFIHMLSEALSGYTKPEDPSEMAELHDKISAAAKTVNLIPPSQQFPSKHEAIAAALLISYSTGTSQYAFPHPDGGWMVGFLEPDAAHWWKATPDHHLTHVMAGGTEQVKSSTGNTAILWNNGHAALEHTAALKEQVTKPAPAPAGIPANVTSLIAKGIGAEVNDAGWGALLPGGELLPNAKAAAQSQGQHQYILKLDGEWKYGQGQPSPTEKAFGYWDITPVGGAVYYPPEKAEAPELSLDKQISELAAQITSEPNTYTLEHKLAYAIKEADTYTGQTHYVYRNAPSFDGWAVTNKYPAMAAVAPGTKVYKVDSWSAAGQPPLPGAAVTEMTPSESIDSEMAAGSKLLPKQAILELLHGAVPEDGLKEWEKELLAPEEPELPFDSKPGWDDLAKLIKDSKPLTLTEATQDGSIGALVAHLLQVTTPTKPIRYFTLTGANPDLPVIAKPAIGSHGHPTKIIYMVTWQHEVTVWGSQGQKINLDPAEVQTIAKDWLHNIGGAPVTLIHEPGATAQGVAVNGKAFPLGSEVYYSVNHTDFPGPQTIKYVKKPDGTWWTVSGSGEVDEYQYAAPQELVSAGTLKPVPAEFIPGSPGFAAAAEPTESGLLDLAAATNHTTGAAAPLKDKLGKAIVKSSTNSSGVGATKYVSPMPSTAGKWSYLGTTKPAAKEEYYAVTGTAVTHYTNYGAGVHVLTPNDVAELLKGEPAPSAPAPSTASPTWDDITKLLPDLVAKSQTNNDTDELRAAKLAWAISAVSKDKTAIWYVKKGSTIGWMVSANEDSAASGTPVYQIKTPPGYGHPVVYQTAGSQLGPLNETELLALLKPGVPLTSPEPPAAVANLIANVGWQLWHYPPATGTAQIEWYGKDQAGGWHAISVGGTSAPVKPEALANKQAALKYVSGFTTPPVPEGPPIPVAWKGHIVGEVPAGSKLYNYPSSAYDSDTIYIRHPDGKWSRASSKYSMSKQSAPTGAKYDGWLAAGKLQEIAPPTPEQVAQYTEVKALKKTLHDGAVDPAAKPGPDEPGALGYAVAAGMENYGEDTRFYTWQDEDGSWKRTGFSSEAPEHHYEIDTGTWEGTQHHANGEPDEPIPFSEVKDAVQKWMTPNAVVIHGKLHKYGHYYKAKGKAHLEINGEYSSYANEYKYGPHKKAHYEWHATNGTSKEMTPTAAAAWLGSGEPQWQAMAKGVDIPPAKPAVYASVFKTGEAGPTFKAASYQVWTQFGLAGLSVQPDGSGNYIDPEGKASTKGASEVEQALKNGSLLDMYGTTVVAPGIQPSLYHLFGFGTQAYSKHDLQVLLMGIEQSGGISIAEHIGIVYGGAGYNSLMTFLADKGAVEPSSQYTAIKGLIHELLEVPENKAGPSAPAEIKYLKGLPPGIKGPGDIFATDDLGYAKSPVWGAEGYAGQVGPGNNYYTWDTEDLNAKIKALSQEFGNGKIVGTHLSGLSKSDKAEWLQAFKQGDMVTVFNLDAKGGKVSPAHPGAPKNEATHNIIWGPWAPGETPAQMDVPGAWSDYEKVPLPKTEIDNYLIKANLQHAAFLDAAEKRQWVTWHRKKNQTQVDILSKQAHDRYNSGASPLTGVPEWTEGIHPAKSYDLNVEEKTPASDWSLQATEDFAEDHKNDPGFKDAWQQWSTNTGSAYSYEHFLTAATYNKMSVVQTWLDALAAKEQAEKLKPVYHTEPGPDAPNAPWSRVSDQFGWKGWWRSGDGKFTAHELAVAQLAKLWGYRTPETREAELEDSQGIAHEIPKNSAPLDAQPDFTKLTERQLQDIAREHVLSWALDAPSTPGTHYVMGDGSIVSGDHSAAYTQDLGHWDGLALNGQENLPADQLSSQLYQAIMGHQVSHALADQAYIAAMRSASRISKTPDSRMKEILSAYAALKPSALNVDGILARKDALPQDFQAMWAQVYKKAGWKLPPVPKDQLRFGLYSGFSEPKYFDHVIAAKSYGVPAFFGGSGLEQGHVLVWTELAGAGADAPRLIRGETGARGSALDTLTAWAKAHQTAGPENFKTQAQEGGVKNAGAYSAHVVSAAKAVSRHAADQMFEGKYTKAALDQMLADKIDLGNKIKAAEDALAAGPDSKVFADAVKGDGHPYLVRDMAKYYLAQIAKVETAKANAQKFQQGDLPEWKAPEIPAKFQPGQKKAKPKAELKVELKKVVRELGTPADLVTKETHLLGAEDGELHVGAAKPGAMFPYPGLAWHITLPTGEVIEFNDGPVTNTPKGQTGRIRFKADATQGSKSLENVRAFLESAGLPMPEATEPDMELLYWRQLAGTLADRQDWNAGPHADVWNTLQQHFTGHGLSWSPGHAGMLKNLSTLRSSGITPDEEIALWRKAWANLTTPEQVDKFAADGGYLPFIKHWDLRSPDTPNGKPVWYHFEQMTPKQQAWLGGRKPVSHNFHDGSKDAVLVSRTGGVLATEARLRTLGTSISGMSSASDMSDTYGSAGFLFTDPSDPDHTGSVKIHPKVLATTAAYGWGNDKFGDISQRKSAAYFDVGKTSQYATHELMVPEGVSLLDDVEQFAAAGETQRQKIIGELKAKGITSIRGVPVEKRVVTSVGGSALEEIRAANKANAQSMFARPEVDYEPPPSNVITSGQIETEAEKAGAEELNKPGALASEVEGLAASTDHAPAVPASALNQVLYGQDSYDSSYGYGTPKAAQAKYAVAERVAAEMVVPTSDLEAFHGTLDIQAPENWGKTIRERTVASMIAIWAHDNAHTPLGIALQDEARKLFGLPGSETVNPVTPAALVIEEQFGNILRDFIRAQYQITQNDLAKGEIDKVTVYRIFKFPDWPEWAQGVKPGDMIDVPPQRAVSAWSYLKEGPGQDAIWGKGQKHLMVKTTVPAGLVMSTPRSGLGAMRQAELTILDSPGQWQVVEGGGAA